MEIVFKGHPSEIEKFVNEIIYPIVREKVNETNNRYFRITMDDGVYYRRSERWGYRARKMRGYFPEFYHTQTEGAKEDAQFISLGIK